MISASSCMSASRDRAIIPAASAFTSSCLALLVSVSGETVSAALIVKEVKRLTLSTRYSTPCADVSRLLHSSFEVREIFRKVNMKLSKTAPTSSVSGDH